MSLITLAGLHAVEQTINVALLHDAPAQRQLARLKGQQILIEVDDFSLLLLIQILEEGVSLSLPDDLAVCELMPQDTHVKGSSSAFRKLLDGDGFFDGELRIQGNAQTLMTLHKVMEGFELDWEGILADKIGDIASSFIAPLLRKKWHWTKNTVTTAKLNLVEYLQEEALLLPTKSEFNCFIEDLESLSTQLDRLETRTALFIKKINS